MHCQTVDLDTGFYELGSLVEISRRVYSHGGGSVRMFSGALS